jgi:hypothetical protein
MFRSCTGSAPNLKRLEVRLSMAIRLNKVNGSGLYRPRKFTAMTKQRFYRDRWKRLTAHVGGAPNERQKVVIESIVRVEWLIMRLSARLEDEGELPAHASRELLAFHNHLRLLSRELGLKPAAAKPPSLAEYIAARDRTKAAGEVAA